MSVINVQNLTRDYGSGKGLFDVSFQVKKGEEMCIRDSICCVYLLEFLGFLDKSNNIFFCIAKKINLV